MNQGVFLGFGARQSLALSPRLQQAIRLLQMSSAEFEQEIRDALASNPFLEEQVAEPETASGNDAVSHAAQISSAHEVQAAGNHVDELSSYRDERAGEWPSQELASRHRDNENQDAPAWTASVVGLREHLRQQLYGSRLGPRETLAVELLIETVDDDGYLRDDVGIAMQALQLEQPLTGLEIERARVVLRSFDPAGVGAADLVDCLRLQLQASDARGRELAMMLLQQGLDLLARRDFCALRNRFDRSESDIRNACLLIRRMDPRPGARFSSSLVDHIVPDVMVVIRGGRPQVAINPSLLPRARLNGHYVDLLRGCRRGHHPAMGQQLQQARWLLRNAEQRFITIQRVAEAIVDRQREFFVHGDLALRPMALREIADEVGLHESTVSRATGNKYMATPLGLFEFKHFFSRQLAMSNGGACSAASVRALMHEIIGAEDIKAPLSDVTIADLLQGQGIKVARRTVAKYRTMMRVLPAELRRQA